ncbi:MAG: radical SAM protein [Anaeromyxobacteraceae bacterium]
MRVLLVSINRLRYPYPVYPLGLNHVAAALTPRHEVRIVDLCPGAPGDGTLEAAVRGYEADVVGVSIRNVDNTDATAARGFTVDARQAVESIRSCTRAPIVLGGAGYALFPVELLEATGADHGFIGDGAVSGPLFEALASGRSPAGLPGVVTAGDSLPQPARARGPSCPAPADLNPSLPWYLSHGGMLNLQTQRGCPFKCIYCTYPGLEGSLTRPVREGVGVVARRLQDAGARFISVADSVFNTTPDHALAVGDAFRDAGVSVPWSAFLAPTRPPESFFARLAGAGLSHVEFGTESLSDPMLARIRKSFRREDVERAHAAARAAGLHVAHFLLLGGPGETSETVEETLSRADRLEGAAWFVFCGMRIYPGTTLHETAVREGQLSEGNSLLNPTYYRPLGISLEEIERRVRHHTATRPGWVMGDGSERAGNVIQALHARGRTGPLWELLVDA